MLFSEYYKQTQWQNYIARSHMFVRLILSMVLVSFFVRNIYQGLSCYVVSTCVKSNWNNWEAITIWQKTEDLYVERVEFMHYFCWSGRTSLKRWWWVTLKVVCPTRTHHLKTSFIHVPESELLKKDKIT